ncbi:hypothetical protein HMPREF0973_02536 [Prevotella veroralis F0319]|uniref:Uncharacterized protein n=1 Tax=Prevotella veroralis F0319 TaxID=649761 RepID=C9MSB8_9BACT|nr:hypothetical protein HMPREF0973_02536 [Prevotella veroralis F0319]
MGGQTRASVPTGWRFLAMKRAFLRCEETPSLFVNSSVHSPLHSERGWG